MVSIVIQLTRHYQSEPLGIVGNKLWLRHDPPEGGRGELNGPLSRPRTPPPQKEPESSLGANQFIVFKVIASSRLLLSGTAHAHTLIRI
jgi:hypothetical protein